MKLYLAQFNPVIGNPKYNAFRILEVMKQAKESLAEMVLFGELALCGYYSQDLFFNDSYIDEVWDSWLLIKAASDKLQIGIGIGIVTRNKYAGSGLKHLSNSFIINFDGKEHLQHKVLLPTYGEFDENRWFESGDIKEVRPVSMNSCNLGFMICEDGWNNKYGIKNTDYCLYKDDPIAHLVASAKSVGKTLDCLVNISASPDYIGKQVIRIEMYKKIAKQYKTPIVFLNVVGSQDELVFGGRSFVINSVGELIIEMSPFEEDGMFLDIDEISSLKPIESLFLKNLDPEMAELDAMIGCYLKDYVRKSGISAPRFVLGLSGGKDSTAVAVALKRHLGAEKILGIMMPYKFGEYTQGLSKTIADALAQKLGIEIREIAIDSYVDELRTDLGCKEATLAHQNLQARIRSTILWTIANQEGRIVVNTTNFSEAAMGYGTIGGDLLGLPLIASIPATIVFRYLRWLQQEGEGSIADDVINRAPSAELAPNQEDSKELGDYDYIDPIIESLRMNFGDINKVVEQFMTISDDGYKMYNESSEKRAYFAERLAFLATKLLVNTEFKRWYYNKTPQFTPFSWLRWKWPLANGYFDLKTYIDSAITSKGT